MIKIEKHKGISVLRDDLLPGGTKYILMPSIVRDAPEYIYATPVYGAFQIALSIYCNQLGKKATIFCAERNVKHPNTLTCIQWGANVIEVPHGYLSVVEKRAKEYLHKTLGAEKIVFGANTEKSKEILTRRVKEVIKELGHEPLQIWCALGSGTLAESILAGTENAKVVGVQVGAEYTGWELTNPRLEIIKHNLSFEKPSKYKQSFQSMPNYDLKAWEYCNKYKCSKDVLFWNVY